MATMPAVNPYLRRRQGLQSAAAQATNPVQTGPQPQAAALIDGPRINRGPATPGGGMTRPQEPVDPTPGAHPTRPQQPAGVALEGVSGGGATQGQGQQAQQPPGRSFTYYGAQYAGDNQFASLYDVKIDKNGGGQHVENSGAQHWRMPLYKAAQAQGVNVNANIQGHGNIGEAILMGQFDPFVKDGKVVLVNAGNPNEVYDAQSGQRLQGGVAGTAIGGGGGAQGGGPGGGPGGGGAQWGGLEGDTAEFIRKLMAGEEGPFTEETQADMRSQSAARRSADIQNANEMATLAAARGGTAQSPAQAAILAQNAREGRSGAASDALAIRSQAAEGNFKARLQGLEQAQATINRTYQDAWNKAENETQRLQIEKQWQAEMAKIASQEKLARDEMAQQRELAEAAAAAAGAARGQGRAWDLEDRQAQWDRDDFLYQRDLPERLLGWSMQFGD